MQTTNLAFRILYKTLYYALYLVLLGVLIVSPADLMRQAVQHNNNTNILIIAASYLVTILVLLFVYAARLFINRSVLASIPKSWIPVDKSDGVPRKVREVIARDLSRSAAVSWAARPRFAGATGGSRLGTTGGVGGSRSHGGGSRGEEDGLGGGVGKERNGKGLPVAVQQPPPERRVQRMMSRLRRSSCTGGGDEEKDIAAAAAVPAPLGDPESPPVWGEIEHPGWASPTSPDLPNLQYNAVISELPNLIEAKALTLAPRDPESRTEPPALDPDAVAVLQRPETMGVRDYLVHLTEIEVLAPAVVGPFISMYEMARFSTRPMSNQQFRELMHVFAEVLRGMQPLNPAVLLEEYDDDDDDEGGDGGNEYGSAIYDTDIDNDAPQGTSSSSGGEGEEGGSIHGPITTTTNNNTNDEAKSRRSRKRTKLRDTNHHTETYNTNDNLNTTNYNFNNNNVNNLSTRLPSSSSGNSNSISISTSSASLSSQRRYSKRQSLATPGTGAGAGAGAGTPGRTTPSIMMRNSSANTWQQNSQQFRTAPTTPKSRRTVLTTKSSRRSSSSTSTSRTGGSNKSIHSGLSGDMDSFAQTRHPFIVGWSSEGEGAGSGSGDGSSMHSGGPGESSGGSVVIRLANGDEESVNGLPYILGMGRPPMVGT